MKKILSTLLCAVMLLSAILALSACGHTHDFSPEWTYNESQHWHVCSGCDETADRAAHAFSAWESTGAEQHKRSCACGKELIGGHTWGEGEVTTPATPDADGVETFTCTLCSETKEEPISYGHVHSYDTYLPDSDTHHKRVCSCEAEIFEEHGWDDGEITTEPSATAPGVRTYTCAACGDTYTEPVAYTVINPYANVNWTTAEQIKSMTHWHISRTQQDMFQLAVSQGYRHFAITQYQPSTPTYPLSEYYTNIPDNVLGSPNSEKVFTTQYGGNVHFNALGSFAEGHGHTNRNPVPWQTAFEEIFDALQFEDGGGITLNHPVYPSSNPTSMYAFMEMLDYDDRVLGIEIYNSGSIRHLPVWDEILSTGRRCWGFAVIDWYNAEVERKTYGSNILLVPAFTEEDCLRAYRNGEFYAQLKDIGLRFSEISCENGVVSVKVNKETTIKFITQNGTVKEVVGTEATYTVSPDDIYVRVEAIETADEASHIFSNPFMFKTKEEVMATKDGALDMSLGEVAWDVKGQNVEDGVVTTVVWEKDGSFTATEPSDLTGYTQYTIEWYNYGGAGPSLDGTAYIIRRQVQIKSIKMGDSTDEASISWGGKTYAAGDTVYRNGQNCWLGLDAFKAPNVISSVFAPAPGLKPIATAGEVASFEANIKIDLGDYHYNGEYYTLGKICDIVIRQGSTNKVTTTLNLAGSVDNYIDVRKPSGSDYYTENNAARGKVGEEFKIRFEIFKSTTPDAYIVKTYVNGILIDSYETAAFDVSNVKVEGIGAATARDLVITVSDAKFIKYVDTYEKHVHTFESEWTTDKTHHWLVPTCDEHDGCDPKYLFGSKGLHEDTDSDGKCDVCNKTLSGVIKVDNPDNLTHTVPTDELEAGETVTFTVTVSGIDSVGVIGATQVGEPTVDGDTKTYTFTIESLDPSATLRIYRIKEGCYNKVDYTTLVVSTEDYKTTYIKISGTTATEGTASNYDYKIVWQYKTLAGPSLDGGSYIFGRSVKFTSVTASGSEEETSFTIGGVTYQAGSVPNADALLSATFNGSTSTLVFASDATVTAPTTDANLRLVWDTDLVVSAGTASGDQQLKVLYKTVTSGGTNLTSTDAIDVIIRNGNNVYYKFGSTKHLIGTVGTKINIRVEIREITGVDTDTNDDGTVDYRPVEIKLYANGVLVDTREDQVDASSGKYDAMPDQVTVNPVKACRDEKITFTNTYLDVYTAPTN